MINKIMSVVKDTVDSNNSSSYGKIWKSPIVKTVSAFRNEFRDLKKIISQNHLLPEDILPEAKSVICFFIPFEEHIVESNIGGRLASAEWAEAYIKTNNLISLINNELAVFLKRHGYSAGIIPATHNFKESELISDWSHRHAAYIAGLGTFGINNMLITDSGCCGRLGSLITDCEFIYTDEEIKEKCLFKIDGSCGICRAQCFAGAYNGGKYDRFKCYEVCLENAEYYEDTGYAGVCGKCAAGLPCSSRDPLKKVSRSIQ